MRTFPLKNWNSFAFSLVQTLLTVSLAGCGLERLDTTYGRTGGESVNGVGVFADRLERRGHQVRTAFRLSESVETWADTIIRVLPNPGPVSEAEGDWYYEWQLAEPARDVILVCRDYEAQGEYWRGVLEQLESEDASDEFIARVRTQLRKARAWPERLPPEVAEAADPYFWFEVGDPLPETPKPCERLEGPWAEGIDAETAAVMVRRPLVSGSEAEIVLLSCNGEPLVFDWHWGNHEIQPSRALVLANGSFLLNGALVHPERRALAARVVEWIGPPSRRIAFVEGPGVLGEEGSAMPTPWDLLGRWPELGWIVVHFLILGAVACLARAIAVRHPRPQPASDVGRLSSHAEALGALLARTRDIETSRSVIERYQRWRRPQARAARGDVDDGGAGDGPPDGSSPVSDRFAPF